MENPNDHRKGSTCLELRGMVEKLKSPNIDGKESSGPLNILSMSVGGGGGASVLV